MSDTDWIGEAMQRGIPDEELYRRLNSVVVDVKTDARKELKRRGLLDGGRDEIEFLIVRVAELEARIASLEAVK